VVLHVPLHHGVTPMFIMEQSTKLSPTGLYITTTKKKSGLTTITISHEPPLQQNANKFPVIPLAFGIGLLLPLWVQCYYTKSFQPLITAHWAIYFLLAAIAAFYCVFLIFNLYSYDK